MHRLRDDQRLLLMRRFAGIVAVVGMIVASEACSSTDDTTSQALPSAPGGKSPVVVTVALPEPDQPTLAREATVAVGGDLEVILGSNPTTGYSWDITSQPDMGVLQRVGKGGSPPPTPLPGAPGTQSFSFSGVSSGSTTIEFTYWQPFDKDAKPAQVLTLNVEVV